MKTFSSGETLIIVSIILAYIIFTAWLSVKLRSKDNSQFMTAGKSMPTFIVGVLLMSEYIGAKSTVGTAQSAFQNGMAASWSVLAASIGFIFYGLFFVKKLYDTGEFTISGAIEKKYGKSTKLIVSVIMIYALFLVNVGNYISGASALVTVLKVNLPVAMIIIGIVSTIYFSFGGMKGVAYVTVLHSAVKYVGVMIIVATALVLTHGVAPITHSLPHFYFTGTGKIGITTVIGWIIATGGSIFSTQFVVQAISSTKNAKSAQKSTMIAAAFCIPLALAIAFAGVSARYLFPHMKSLYALPIFIQSMSPVLAGIVATSLVASVFVSVSTVALGIVSLIVSDFYVPHCKPTPEKQLKMTRIISVIIGFAPLIFAFYVPQILSLSFFTRALRLSIGIVAVIAFYCPFFNSSRGANLGLIGAAIATTIWYLLNNPFGIDNIYVSIVVPIIVMVIERLLHWNKKPESKVA
ncbi:sodium/glucose cotransporter [Clostridium ragsdalei P11]|uniref:Sodium/glucose cotransporter n=1 Tax=Clostridium ragsdalei P11 TaxID=1353534 RepID=A0A1A6APE4_9CLOT|nr:sodium:solute symporter family protein [Clostridium ragsdalei]OBR91908.1 sodium/glucose cotransporter [Clostridium ragsdalei P11]